MASLFTPRIGLRELAQLCRRLAIALSSGIEVRRVFEREASDTRSLLLRSRMREISDAVARGDSVAEGMALAGDFFPPLVHELVDVGEHTGHLAEIFRHLAEHYEEQLRLKRSFLSSITWPMVQLVLAIGIIGIMILVMGWIGQMKGSQPIDLLGLGLIGPSGFAVYCLAIGTIFGGGFFVFQAARRGLAWTEPVQKLVLQLPGIGGPLKTISLAQLAWTMELTMEAGMELLKAMRLSLDSTRNAFYTSHTGDVLKSIRAGNEIHEALADTGAFPSEFLMAVEVGERSGRLPEAMRSLSREYHERARHAVQTLTVIAGWGVWALVAMMIVMMIIRMFSAYLGVLNDALKM